MTESRSALIDAFLARHGWAGARRGNLAGDASFRRYERVYLEGRQAVLMDAPPGKEDIRPFIRIGGHLLAWELSAPRILASDAANGLMLLEDLGDDLFARVLSVQPQREEALYLAAADALAQLHERSGREAMSDLHRYDRDEFVTRAALLCEWFLPQVAGEETAREQLPVFRELFRAALGALPELGEVMVLRDFHAENLLWLPERSGVQRVGLLDFQDAIMGPPAYDMVSFLEDARRDVAQATVDKALKQYLAQTRLPAEKFMTAYALLGAQRNCRIIGTFARLSRRDGKHHYLAFLPRVWAHLERDLAHPALQPIKRWMDEVVRPEWRGVLRAAG